jgi:hypothetical protein
MSEQIFTLLDEIYEGRKPLSALSELSQEGRQINYFHLWVQHRIAKECVKEQDAILKEINSHIKLGVLPGNGLDQTAERNGLITASNIVTKRYTDSKPSFIPMAHESKSRLHGCSQCDAIVECVGHEHDGGLFVCSECNDEREHYHGKATGVEVGFEGSSYSTSKRHECKYGDGSGTMAYFTTERLIKESLGKATNVRIFGDGDGSALILERIEDDSPLKVNMIEVWTCTAHAPGSEIEVKKGESCYCGRTE